MPARCSLAFLRVVVCIGVALVVLAPHTNGQIVRVRLVDSEAARKNGSLAIPIGNGSFLFGEPRSVVKPTRGTALVQLPTGSRLELIVLNQASPERVPYDVRDGELDSLNRKWLVGIQSREIASIEILLPDSSLQSLSVEYARRTSRVNELDQASKQFRRNTPEWARHRSRVFAEYDRYRTWLESCGLVERAAEVAKELEGIRSELRTTMAPAYDVETMPIGLFAAPADLVKASQVISGGSDTFRVAQSLHARVTYVSELPDDAVVATLRLIERTIATFRRCVVDPYVGDGFVDPIPDRAFCHFWFGPNDLSRHERYFEEYLGFSWGEGSDRSTKIGWPVKFERGKYGAEYLVYSRYWEGQSIRHTAVHSTGHHLAAMLYQSDLGRDPSKERIWMPWIQEALGYDLSIELLGFNGFSCTSTWSSSISDRASELRKSRFETHRDYYQRLALEPARSFLTLAVTDWAELSVFDTAKAWSLFDHLVRSEGLRGQQFLRAGGTYSHDPETFQSQWRATAESLFGVTDADVFQVLEDRWRTAVTESQR